MLLIGNGRMITRDSTEQYLDDGCVAIEGQFITEVGSTVTLKKKYPQAEFIDACGKLIMPGLINAHTHIYSAFARGMALKSDPPQNFVQILERLWWKLDKALTLEDVYYSALAVLIDCVKNGTTTIFDHHASPGAVTDSLFTIARAVEKVGVKSCLCYEVSDRDGADVMQAGIRENMDFIKSIAMKKNGLLQGMFGLHAAMTLNDDTLEACTTANADSGVGFHVHVAEDLADQADSLSKYGKRVIERLDSFGILGDKTIAVHCVHVDEYERNILKCNGTMVVHNPESNMGNAVGCAEIISLFEQGVFLGLGTDGYTGDMFESYKVGNILHKYALKNPSVAWGEIPQMLFVNNPVVSAKYFPIPAGKLIAGWAADVIVVDYLPFTPLTANNINGHILFGINGRQTVTTVVDGKILMQDKVLLNIDDKEVCARSRELSQKLWQRI